MLSSYTSSEEDNIPYLRMFVQTIRNNNKGPKLLKIPLTSMRVLRTSPPGSRPRLVSYPLEENPLQPVLTCFITVFIQCNEGLENNLTGALLLGLAKSIYYMKVIHRYRRCHGFKSRTGFNLSGLIFTTAQVLFITAKIVFVLIS